MTVAPAKKHVKFGHQQNDFFKLLDLARATLNDQEKSANLSFINTRGRTKKTNLTVSELAKDNEFVATEDAALPYNPAVITGASPYETANAHRHKLAEFKPKYKRSLRLKDHIIESVYKREQLDVTAISARANSEKLLPESNMESTLKKRRPWSPHQRQPIDNYPLDEPPPVIHKPNVTIAGRRYDNFGEIDQSLVIGELDAELPLVYMSCSEVANDAVSDFAWQLYNQRKYQLLLNAENGLQLEAIRQANLVVCFVTPSNQKTEQFEVEARALRRYRKKLIVVPFGDVSDPWFDRLIVDQSMRVQPYEPLEDFWLHLGETIDQLLQSPALNLTPRRCGVRFLGDNANFNQRWVDRPELEENLQKRVVEILQHPLTYSPILLVHGEAGIGKSALVNRAMSGNFLSRCQVGTRLYLNVAKLTEQNSDLLFEMLAELLQIKIQRGENVQRALQTHLRKTVDKKTLVILDGVRHRRIFEALKTLGQERLVIICVARRNFLAELASLGWINEPALQISDMPIESMKTMFEICGDRLCQATSNRHDILDRMAELCMGRPLLGQIISGRVLAFKYQNDLKDYIKLMEMHYTRYKVQLAASQLNSDETIGTLLTVNFEHEHYEFRRRLYAFLLFEDCESVDIEDLAILWGCEMDEAADYAAQLMDQALVRSDHYFQRYNIHSLLRQALIDFVLQGKDPDYKDLAELNELRQVLLAEWRNVETGENSWLVAIARQREHLFRAIQNSASSDSALLFELCNQRTEDQGETVLHLLFKREWPKVAVALASSLLETLLKADRYQADELLSSVLDSDENSILQLMLRSMQNGMKWSDNLLFVAADLQCYQLVDVLLDNGIDVNTEDADGNTLMSFAALNCNSSFINRLMQRDVDFINVNQSNQDGQTALMISSRLGDFKSCKTLLEESEKLQLKIDLNVKDNEGDTALNLALRRNKRDIVRLLIEHGASVNVAGRFGDKALWLSLLNGDLEAAALIYGRLGSLQPDESAILLMRCRQLNNADMQEMLVRWSENETVIATDDKGFPVYRRCHQAVFRMLKLIHPESSADEETTLAFFRYCFEGNYKSLRTLTLGNKPFDQSVKDTGLFMAAYFGHVGVVEFLADDEEHANPNFVNANGITSLIAAASNLTALPKIVDALLEACVNVDAAECLEHKTALILASAKGHDEVAGELLEAGANVEAFDDDGMTALLHAAFNGHLKIVAKLLSKKANVEARNNLGRTALMLAAQIGHEELTKLLIQSGKAMIDNVDKTGRTALMLAAENCHVDSVRVLLASKANVNLTEHVDGWSALMFASKNDVDGKTVSLIIPFRAEINAQDRMGRTPLMIASENGRDAAVEALLDQEKLKVDTRTFGDEMTALMIAAKFGHDSIVRQLLARNADINATNKSGLTPLLLAIEQGQSVVVGTLIRRGADINASKPDTGMSGLMMAADRGYNGVVRTLVSYKALDVNAQTKDGAMTALMIAALKGHDAVMETMLLAEQHQFDLNVQQADGYTALMFASIFGHDAAALILLRFGADQTLRDKSGNTALSYAAENGHVNIVKMLMEANAEMAVNKTDEELMQQGAEIEEELNNDVEQLEVDFTDWELTEL